MTVLTATDNPARRWWLFSPGVDVAVFAGSAALSLVAVWVGWELGLLNRDTPEWTWIYAVLLVDVAHVWSTGFRVYFDPQELRRRPGLYVLTPIGAFLAGAVLYSFGEMVFWRALAYVAVYHFVRQQYGWVALYRARLKETEPLGKWIDTLAIYAATIYPLLYWHAHMPRNFWWFLPNDFTQLPEVVETVATPIYWLLMAAYAARAAWNWRRGRPNPGKDMVLITTALCWYIGIITLNSDYAFTVTNVLIHGVPYIALVYWYSQRGKVDQQKPAAGWIRRAVPFMLTLWALAYCEEMFWDRAIWHERPWLFGTSWNVRAGLHMLIVPLLAVPQLTHYILDGFIWKRRSNPEFNQAIQDANPQDGRETGAPQQTR